MKNLIMPLRKIGFIALLLLSVFSESNAITYYSRQSGLWSVNSTWSTVGYGNATNTGTFPKRGDVVLIGDGHNISMNVNAITASITVGQGTSGSLLYSNYLSFLMVIAGNLTVNAGATFGYASNSGRTHSLFISGNIVNNGTIDLYYDADDLVNMTFNSRVHSIISGTGSWDLNRVSVVKSTLTSYRVEATVVAFENAIRQLVVTYGTFTHNNRGTYNVNPSLGSFTVTPDAIMEVMDGVLHLSPNDDYTYLQGQLKVTSGTMRIGSASGNQGLRYDQSGAVVPTVDISGGTLTVYGGITYRSGNSTDPFRYNQSGGTLLLNSGSTGTASELFKISNSASSRFTISAGTMTLQKPTSGGTGVSDFDLCGTTGTVTVTGGNVIFGNASTPGGSVFNFTPYAGIVMPNFRVSGPAAGSVTLQTSNASTSDFSLLSLYIEANKNFDNRSIAGAAGDSKIMTLTDNFDGVHAFYNDGTLIPRTGTVNLQGAEGLWVGGANVTTFYNLSINNPMGISLSQTINISNQLMMTDGVIYSSAVTPVVCLAGASANLGSTISYVDGPMQQIVASTSAQTINYPVGKNGSFRPIILAVQHSSVTPVTYTSEVWNVSARSMGYSLPPSLGWVSDMRYYTITRTPVANLSNARVTLTYGADDFVTDPSYLRVARDNGSSTWLDHGGTGTASGSGSITSSNFTGFNTYFTLANATGGINPLPVEYTRFTAAANGNQVVLDWATASETNSDYFEVERSRDGSTFQPIGRIAAAGFSTTVRNYQFPDKKPFSGTNYYRLRQVDQNGTYEYSAVRAVHFSQQVLNVFPNPVSNRVIHLDLPGLEDTGIQAGLYDLSGKLIFNTGMPEAGVGQAKIQLPSEVMAGTYLLKIRDAAGNSWQEKIIVTL